MLMISADHVIGSPLSLCDKEFAPKAWQRYADLPAFRAPEISFAQGSAVKVDAEKRIATLKDGITGKTYEESYEYLITATGLKRNFPAVPRSLTKDNYLVEAGKHIELVRNAKEGVVVIGGGNLSPYLTLEQLTYYVSFFRRSRHRNGRRNRYCTPNTNRNPHPLPSQSPLRRTSLGRIQGQNCRSSRENRCKGNSRPASNRYQTSGNGRWISLLSPHTFKRYNTESRSCDLGHLSSNTHHLIPSLRSTIRRRICQSWSFVGSHHLIVFYALTLPRMEFLPNLPNHEYHYAVGDIIDWSGIKRCGAAMSQGYHAAHNIHQRLLQTLPSTKSSSKPEMKLFPHVPPMIAIAIGKTAIMFSPNDGLTFGKDVLQMMFRDDIGFASEFILGT